MKSFFPPAIILAITFITFYPSIHNGFTNWDDPAYVLDNPIITSFSLDNLRQIFTRPVSLNYHPLTMLSLAIDYHYSGLNPRGYHITNLILHLSNTLLVYVFVCLLSGNNIVVAAITSLFFGIHPMHVESVAWISERKDVLYTSFYLGSLITYLKYLNSRKTRWYLAACLLCVFSILSKAVAVMLPVIFLLLDWFRWRKLSSQVFFEKAPLLIVSAAAGAAAMKIQSAAITEFTRLSIYQRSSIAAYGCLMYIYKLFVPTHLSAFYPYPPGAFGGSFPFLYYMCPIAVLVLCIIIYTARRYGNIVVFGGSFYLLTIAPVLQFVSVGRVIIADRYSYIPYIGLFFVLAQALSGLWRWCSVRGAALRYSCAGILSCCVAACGCLAYERTKVWQDSGTLWSDVIQQYPLASLAYKNRGAYYGKELGIVDRSYLAKALADYDVLINMGAADPEVYNNRGNIYGLMGQNDKALEAFDKSIALDGGTLYSFLNKAKTLSKMGRFDRAIETFSKAISKDSQRTDGYLGRGFCYIEAGELDQAIEDYDYVIGRERQNAEAFYYRGVGRFRKEDYDGALEDMLQHLKTNPRNGEAYYNVSVIYSNAGQYGQAYQYARMARAQGYAVGDSYLAELAGRVGQQNK